MAAAQSRIKGVLRQFLADLQAVELVTLVLRRAYVARQVVYANPVGKLRQAVGDLLGIGGEVEHP